MFGDWGDAVQAAIDRLVPLGFLAGALWYLVWVNRPRPVYRWVHLFEFAPEAVNRAYFPRPVDDLAGHPFEGLQFLSGDEARAEVELPSGELQVWEEHPPSRAVTRSTVTGVTSYTFMPDERGTRVNVERSVERGRLLDPAALWARLWAPFDAGPDETALRAWLAERGTPPVPGLAPVPMVARSRLAVALAVAAVPALCWFAGWQLGLGLLLLIVVHELGHVAAARWYGHRDSSFVFVPFLGGLANTGPSADYRELVVKVLAGPLFGLAACAIILALFAALDEPRGIELAQVIIIVHAVNLLPVARLDGGQLVRAIVISLGRVGRYLWLVIGTLLLAWGAYLFLWLLEAWLAVPVLIVGALGLYNDYRSEDVLPKLGWRGILATLAAIILLVAGHVALFIRGDLALGRHPIIELSHPERVRAVHLADEGLVFWSRDGEGWWNQRTDRAPEWGPDRRGHVGPGNRISLRLETSTTMRIDLWDGRQCLVRVRPFARRRLVIDDAAIAQALCRSWPVHPVHCELLRETLDARTRDEPALSEPFRQSLRAFVAPAQDCSGPRDISVRNQADFSTLEGAFLSAARRVDARIVDEVQRGARATPDWPSDNHGLRAINARGGVVRDSLDVYHPDDLPRRLAPRSSP